ncbi:MAG: hypothetical protein E6I92_11130 [Chloroflexi bacterium]|nr:MAG: hypothetical protein E6I92_11130 [Chloroflexota bacterium]
MPELEASLKITEEVLRHLIVRKPEKAIATAVTPPPAEVVLEPLSQDSDEAARRVRRADREDREDS